MSSAPSPTLTADGHPLASMDSMGIGPTLVFGLLVLFGLGYIGYQLVQDVSSVQAAAPWVLLLLAVLIALGFEFVNGFHDTANAVATVIYTHALPPTVAVVWSGCWNLIGVLLSSGAVAYSIVSLLPVELVLNVGSGTGFAMVFALLFSAILWNVGTWYLGLPASSSHTLIGAIVGVGLMNSFLTPDSTLGEGVNWAKVTDVGKALLLSPLIGFVLAAVLLLVMKAMIRQPALFEPPQGDAPPPWPIRLLLVLTCTGVSVMHGSNDGQKGMGLIVLILVGLAPLTFAINPTTPPETLAFVQADTGQIAEALSQAGVVDLQDDTEARGVLTGAIRRNQYDARTTAALARINRNVLTAVSGRTVPAKLQAEAEGLDRVLVEAGFEWRDPGCSMCLGMNEDKLKSGQRCVSTSNRNFEGRQGRGGRTHLVSPAMAAAAAITGKLTDVRSL